ncbi:MAG: phospholipase D-like domain-containing protein [Candidatus Heimdallarchaeaceae archaeon]
MIDLITKPWSGIFQKLVAGSKESIFISSPFIKNSATNILLKNRQSQVELKVLTSFKLAYFRNRASDIESIENLVDAGKVKAVGNLHSKVYLFDKEKAVITSSNLTHNGLFRNFEHGILIKKEGLVKEIYQNLYQIFQDSNISFLITNKKIQIIKKMLSSLPPLSQLPKDSEICDSHELITPSDVAKIIQSLSRWEKDVFEVLSVFQKKEVTLNEVYDYEIVLQKKHPNNKHIKEKIRQQLQYLRDKGLIEFVDRGVYKKLW